MIKSGKNTSEFKGKTALQIITALLGVLVLLDVIPADVSDDLAARLTVLVPLLLELFYMVSRTLVKTQPNVLSLSELLKEIEIEEEIETSD